MVCTDTPTVGNATVDWSAGLWLVGQVINATCLDGYHLLSDGASVQTLTCTMDGWETKPACKIGEAKGDRRRKRRRRKEEEEEIHTHANMDNTHTYIMIKNHSSNRCTLDRETARERRNMIKEKGLKKGQ